MPRKWFKKYLPSAETIHANRWLAWLAPWLGDPHLWTLHRRTVARAVAIGLFAGLMPGPTQMPTAALLALWWRVNLPVALATTLYTNPLTVVPLYMLAYEYGTLILRHPARLPLTVAPEWSTQTLSEWAMGWWHWTSAMGWPLLVGLVALGLTLAALGYISVMLGWRLWVVAALKKRKAERDPH
jgi:uncharacterized protein (DUF2062 family)